MESNFCREDKKCSVRRWEEYLLKEQWESPKDWLTGFTGECSKK